MTRFTRLLPLSLLPALLPLTACGTEKADPEPAGTPSAAARAAHRPGAAGTATRPSGTASPVERGDLPPFGDGAPLNDVEAGG
ncbi:hypothetical protein SUDANB6_01130 [Streptomyces sp. enrichment culture]|uniref:hypothetical protein n=1 Tax=Streptomyces sp. enrichment culture TaxID=1795815 RepID=UPI003F559350